MKTITQLLSLGFALGIAGAAPIPVPNFSFESPVTANYTEFTSDYSAGTGTWVKYGGAFNAVINHSGSNPWNYAPTGSLGSQYANASGITGSGFFQDCAAYDGSGDPDLYWQAGQTYTLKIGAFLRNDSVPGAGRKMDIRLFYRNIANGEANLLAARTLTVGTDSLSTTELNDFTVVWTVLAGAAEVGKPIGIWVTAAGESDATVQWGFDNVRLDREASLLARWQFNETSGTTAASTPSPDFPAEFNNAADGVPALAWEPASGQDGALRISVETDRLLTPALDLTNGFTAMGWIKPDANQPEWARFLNTRYQDGFFLGRDSNTGAWKLIVNGDFGMQSAGTIANGQWQHVCATYDGTTARLYVDGEEVASKAMAPPSVPVQALHMGTETGAQGSFLGLYEEIKIYTGAMPAAYIATLYAAEHPGVVGLTPYETWAIANSLDPQTNGAAEADPDGDGSRNNVEYALGLDPNDPGSRFAATLTGTPATGLTLTWPSQPGLSFAVRSSTSLTSFPTLEASVPAADEPATTTSWTSGPLSGSAMFFRVGFTP